MTRSGKFLTEAALLCGATALALMAATLPASALIACSRSGECWHVRDNYVYRPEFGVVVHPDNWRPGRHEHVRWREHAGRGYWHDGIWITF
jgi:hypothetical protein